MEILVYQNLNPGKLEEKVNKIITCLAAGDFQTADVKKMSNGYYRAKLDYTNRLLFDISEYQDKKYILILEVIHNHAYEKSKFLNGAIVDESKLLPLNDPSELIDSGLTKISYINPNRKSFHVLDKILSFDDVQEEILGLPAPGIIIGSAGSGKTALTLEKLKLLKGNILYTTLSSFLVENASQLYSSFGFENLEQQVSFLSFNEYLSAIHIPEGREVDFTSFERWISRYNQSYKIKDAYRIFEEIKGVITGSSTQNAYLTLDEYMALGIRQSIFPPAEREHIYDLFTKYKTWIAADGFFDSNIVSFEVFSKVTPIYDYIVVDEVQDLTIVQLSLILKSLRNPSNFVLCGDANQIVHPNFFSWAQIKSHFYKQDLKESIVRVLATNYRNTPEVTAIANQLLSIKIARFGSIDKESNYLVIPNSNQTGAVEYLENSPKINQELNSKTSLSAKFAVLVLRNEDKAAARKYYSTPLLFSIHEAKGLEYESIILFNPISTYESEFKELSNGVKREDLILESPEFSRAKDKSDKSLEEYKFYVNALYVGITRAIKNLYMVESNKKHVLLELLGLVNFKQESSLTDQTSSNDEWQKEAYRLEKQGKQEQANAIREQILHLKPVPWVVTRHKDIPELKRLALNPDLFNKKSKDRFFQYLFFYNLYYYSEDLALLKYGPAKKMWEHNIIESNAGMATFYYNNDLKSLKPHFLNYGVDFRSEVNFTPLMSAVSFEQYDIINYLLDNGAKTDIQDNKGLNAMQRCILLLHKFNYADKQKQLFSTFYHKMKPESLKVKINDRLVKIGNHEAEFLMLNLMMVALYPQLETACHLQNPEYFIEGVEIKPGFQTSDFLKFFEGLPEHIVPEYRRTPTYISSILSKNEINRIGPGNKKLFVRLKQGVYVPHPLMEISIDEEWVNIYDESAMDYIIRRKTPEQLYYITLINKFRNQLNENPDAILDQVSYWEEIK